MISVIEPLKNSLEESGREAQLGCIIELAPGTQISLLVSERSGSILFTEKIFRHCKETK